MRSNLLPETNEEVSLPTLAEDNLQVLWAEIEQEDPSSLQLDVVHMGPFQMDVVRFPKNAFQKLPAIRLHPAPTSNGNAILLQHLIELIYCQI